MKKDTGITLIALVTTIIIIFIIVAVASYSGMETYKNMRMQNFVIKMKVIQEKVDLICDSEYKNWDKYGEDSDGDGNSDYNINDYISEIYGKNIINSSNSDYGQFQYIIDQIQSYSELHSTDKVLTNYIHFTPEELESVLGLKNMDVTVIINFATRNVIEKEGVSITEYEKKYRQYDIPGGQQLHIGISKESLTLVACKIVENNGLTKKIELDLSYDNDKTPEVKEVLYGISKDNTVSGIETWHDATKLQDYEYSMANNTISFVLNISGKYVFKVIDGDKKIYQTNIIDTTMVNPPKLSDGMIPIKWDEAKSKWIICSQTDPEWYNYTDTSLTDTENTSKWANIMLSDKDYKTALKNYSEGQEIDESKLGSMFVWIPRYAYKITNGYGINTTSGEIDIQFLQKTSITPTSYKSILVQNNGYVPNSSEDTSKNYFLHPVFQSGKNNGYQNGEWDSELNGFWVAKFEASSANSSSLAHVTTNSSGTGDVTTNMIRVIPNKSSWRYIRVGTSYSNCRNMVIQNSSLYGLVQTEVDSHLMKNSEWGAVSYLAHSKYGLNKNKIQINSNSSFNTGGGDYIANKNQSTTGNVYGVYDLSGGAYERTAGYITNGNSSIGTNGSSDMVLAIEADPITRSTKHVTAYGYNSSNDGITTNYEANKNRYGDAMYETSLNSANNSKTSWFDGYSIFPNTSTVFFVRGGYNGSNTNAGLFYFENSDGSVSSGVNPNCSFRPVLVVF